MPRSEIALEFDSTWCEALLNSFGETCNGGLNSVQQRHVETFRDDHVSKRPRQSSLIFREVGGVLCNAAKENRGNARWLKAAQCINPFDFDHCDSSSLDEFEVSNQWPIDPAP